MTTVNPLEHIAFEDISDEYCYGKYGDFNVIMMKKNGYINATKMCRDISEQTESKKEFRNWKENKSARKLVDYISASAGIPPDELFVQPIVANEIRGTYVHPKLIPHIASWASPKFAVKVADIVNKYFNNKALKKKEKLIRKQKLIIGDHEDKIDELMKKLDKQAEEASLRDEKQSAKIDKLLHKNKKVSRRLKTISEQARELEDQNDELLEKVTDVSIDRVVKSQDDTNSHVFVVMKDTQTKDKDKYYSIRTKQKTLHGQIVRYMKTHPKAIQLLTIDYNPNSINLWDRIKENLDGKISCTNNKFRIFKKYTETELIEDVRKINDEKFEV